MPDLFSSVFNLERSCYKCDFSKDTNESALLTKYSSILVCRTLLSIKDYFSDLFICTKKKEVGIAFAVYLQTLSTICYTLAALD